MSNSFKLGLRGKTTFVLGGLIFLALAVTSFTSYWQSQVIAEQKVMELELSKFSVLKHEIKVALSGHHNNLLSLHDVPPVAAILRAKAHNGFDPISGDSLNEWNARLITIFKAFMQNHSQYFQIRYIDAAGNELVRIEKGAGDESLVADETQLQNKADSDYVRETLKLQPGQTYYSNVSLNREHGIIQVPHVPVLRIATPIHDAENKVAALIVINLSTDELFDAIKSTGNGVQRNIVDEKGYYIKHADSGKTFGLERGGGYRLQDTEPELVEASLSQDQLIMHDERHKELEGFQKVYYSPLDHSRYWLLTLHIPEEVVFSDVASALNKILFVSFAIGLFALLLIVWFVSKKVLTPVVSLAETVKQLHNGNLTVRLDATSARDEFQTLYAAINAFAENQQQATVQLERKVEGQTKRLSAVIDNVIDGIITINDRGEIESFNQAAMRIFGYSEQEVIGRDMNILMPEPYGSEYRTYLKQHMETGEEQIVGSRRELAGRRKDGTTFPMELAASKVIIDNVNYFIGITRDITERKAYEQLVIDEKKQLSAVIDNVVDGIITISERGLIESFNPAARRIFGYSNEEVMGQNVKILMPEPYHSEHDGYLDHHINTGEKKVIGIGREVVGRRKDGSTFPMELAVSEVVIDSIRHFIGITRDITERKLFENELKQQSESLAAAQRIAHLGNWDLDVKSGQWYWSDEIFRIFGFSPGDVEPSFRKFLKQVHSEDTKQVSKAFRDSGKSGKAFVIDCRIARADGTRGVIHLNAETICDESGATVRMIGTVFDITERKAFEQRILNEESRLKAIIDNVVDGIITISERGLISSFNPAAENIFGYRFSEVHGNNVKMLMPEPYHGEHDGYLSNFRRTGEKKIIGIGREVTGRRKDGSTFPMELAVSEVTIDGVRNFVGITRDITERKRIEQMQKEFISTVSHELRTPLTSIRGSLGLILGGVTGALPEKAKALLTIANNNSERLIHLINDILDIEKIAAGKMQFDYTVVNLIPVVQQAVESNKGYGDQLHVRFEFVADADKEVLVRVDEKRLAQVISNLLSNAAKYSPANETVEISIEASEKTVRICVFDHGKGIPEDFKSRIFAKFSQADSSDTRQKGGTGLGLNISKTIIEQHGGSIGFDSGVGRGTTFYVDLPIYHEQGKALVTASVHDEESSDRPLILIVEDDKDVAKLLGMMLEKEGYRFHLAFSYQEAKQQIQNNRYEAITLDLMIPGGSGIGLLRELRANEITKNLPVIVVSAKANEGRLEVKSDAISMVDWIEKPIDEERLLESIRLGISHVAASRSGRILHVEDDSDIAVIVDSLLGSDCQVVHAESLQQARAYLNAEVFDLVLLDIGLPDGSGLDLLPILNSRELQTPVIIFSAQDVSPDIAAQVNGTLVKSKTDNEKLIQQIKLAINK